MTLRPFFTFFGSKWRVANHYPRPTCGEIVEPFAGAAGYSMRHAALKVSLYDIDPAVCGVWDYLIRSSTAEIMALPEKVDCVDDIDAPQEARDLVGFWLNKGTTRPSRTPSAWVRGLKDAGCNAWGPGIKERVARQQPAIRHWTITQASYADIPDRDATWFVDPPYEVAGKHYRFHDIDYPALGAWCRARTGQVIVCENAGATWLPFVPFRTIKGLEGKHGGKKSEEVIWTNKENN